MSSLGTVIARGGKWQQITLRGRGWEKLWNGKGEALQDMAGMASTKPAMLEMTMSWILQDTAGYLNNKISQMIC